MKKIEIQLCKFEISYVRLIPIPGLFSDTEIPFYINETVFYITESEFYKY